MNDVPPEFLGLALPTWLPRTEPGAGEPDGSRFGGHPWVPAGTTRPCCDGCGRVLRLMLQVHPRDLPIEFHQPQTAGLLQVFACVELDEEGFAAREVPLGTGSVIADEEAGAWAPRRIVEFVKSQSLPGYEDLPNGAVQSLAKPALHRYLNARLDIPAEIARIAQGKYGENDRLGGWPDWVQQAEWPECSDCGKPMPLLFQFASRCNIDELFGDAGLVWVFRCPSHPDSFESVVQCS